MATKPPPRPKPPQELLPPQGLGPRIDRALLVEDLVGLMAEAARMSDTPDSHRLMDDALLRLVQILSIAHPKAKEIREITWKYSRADRWYG